MLRLQAEGCHNINFVTPEHVVPQILEALLLAVEGGLRLPLIYNTSAYDSAESLRLMHGVVDVYMPDFKLWDRDRSRRYLLAPDYPDAAREGIRRMHDQVGGPPGDRGGPGGAGGPGPPLGDARSPRGHRQDHTVTRYLGQLSLDTYLNLMDQYYPAYRVETEEKFQEIRRRVTRRETEEALAAARAAGLWRFDTRWRRFHRPLQLWA